jgi:hypothetical protein
VTTPEQISQSVPEIQVAENMTVPETSRVPLDMTGKAVQLVGSWCIHQEDMPAACQSRLTTAAEESLQGYDAQLLKRQSTMTENNMMPYWSYEGGS